MAGYAYVSMAASTALLEKVARRLLADVQGEIIMIEHEISAIGDTVAAEAAQCAPCPFERRQVGFGANTYATFTQMIVHCIVDAVPFERRLIVA